MNITPDTAMHTIRMNLMQLIFGSMLAFSAGGGATYLALTNIDVTCYVPRADVQSDEAMKQFMAPAAPLPMNQGKRY